MRSLISGILNSDSAVDLLERVEFLKGISGTDLHLEVRINGAPVDPMGYQ